jgi:hypothetical protein
MRFHQFVDETPSNGGVVHSIVAAESAVHLGHDKRRAAHALYAASDHQRGLTRLDCTRRRAQGVQARAAQAVEGGARHIDGQASEQTGHVGHVAVVFAGLVGTAVNHIRHGLPIHLRVARH